MELRHLRYFLAVAEELHFGRAAERLSISQPPLSTQIRDLEQELGVVLFERTRRQVKLSPCGRIFLTRVRTIFSELESAIGEVRRIDSGEGATVTISYLSAFVLQMVSPLMNQWSRDFPNVEIRLMQTTTAEQYEAVKDHRVDIGFVDAPPIANAESPGEFAQIAGTRVVRMRMAMAMAADHPLAHRKRVRLQEFSEDNFVMPKRSSVPTVHELQVGLCQRAGFSPRVRAYTDHLPQILALVAAGVGVAFATEDLFGSWPGMIHFAKLQEAAYVSIYAIYRPDNDNPASRAFADLLRSFAVKPNKPASSR